MSVFEQQLKINHNGKTYKCKAYTTEAEAKTDSGVCLKAKINGSPAYFALTSKSSIYSTPLRIKMNGNIYLIATQNGVI